MNTQLGLDGAETVHPVRHPRPLTDRQREVVAYMHMVGVVRPREIGILMHAGRPTFTDMRHASSDGVDALKRLARRGLVERVARGKWQLTEHDERWTTTL